MPDVPEEPTLALPGGSGAVRRPRRGFGRTLTARAILTTCAAALISVVVTALVAVPFAVHAANSDARASLRQKAQLAAEVLAIRSGPAAQQRVIRQLASENVYAFLIHAGRADRAGLPPRIVSRIASGQNAPNEQVRIGGRVYLVEGRALPNRSGDGVVLATARVGLLTLPSLWRRLGAALLAGLAAGAVAGALLASRLTRPIRDAAMAAARLSAGDRSVRVRPQSPVEAEELAYALNDLAAALATSEGRQRDFLLSVSHELRTPLTTIKGYAEALADGVIGPDGAPRAGQTVIAEADHLDRLINDLLALARLDAADFPLSVLDVDLAGLLRATAEAWGGRCAAAGVVLRTEIPTVPVLTRTDPGRVRQIVDGLLENALRIVPPGAPVVLAVRPPDAPAGPGLAGFAIVEVRDGGPGFTDEDLAVAFERGALYERYRGVRKVGSGLGLALAAGLVRRLGGRIEAGHAPEGGARFTVSLPAYPALMPYQART